jgi:eukaryotic-like serine/threonine-protein kinase
VQTDPGIVYQFGPFEVNVASGELLKNGRRVKLQEQPHRILVALLENPGEVITREELRSRLWPDDTFVDFDGSLRVAVRKLREALNDNADDPRYIETVPKRGYRFLVPGVRRIEPDRDAVDVEVSKTESNSSDVVPASAKPNSRNLRWWWLAFPLAGIAGLLIWSHFRKSPAATSDWKLTQLTTDTGSSNSSAISPDGKLVAYSSDRSKEGQYDLYVKQVTGGDPIRLTFGGSNNTAPDFSPDGSRIVFQSTRDGGGIFEIPAFGGEARLLARDGQNPKYSPDGSQVAYWVGAGHVAMVVPGGGSVWVVPIAGGHPQQVGENFTAARRPIWAPDGAHLIVVGYTSNKAYERSALDWWVVPVSGGPALRTGLNEALSHSSQITTLPNQITLANPYPGPQVPSPSCWLAATKSVVFSSAGGDASNLWEIGIDPATGRVRGNFTKLTTGAGNEWAPACASANAITFTNSEFTYNVWVLPFDLDKGQPKGKLERLTNAMYAGEGVSLSRDGRTLAFSSNQTGILNIWLRQPDDQQSLLASSQYVQRFPAISPTGDKIAFSSFEPDKRVLYLSTPGRSPEALCDNCIRATDWSSNEKTLLVFSESPYQINLLDIATHQQTPLLKRTGSNLLYGRFSPDNRWVSFTMRIQPNRAWIMLAPIDGPRPVPEDAWIKIAEVGAEDWANWSPDGKTLYFTSPTDGYTCLWGQRIDAESHHPLGEPFAVQHFHGGPLYHQGGWSAAGRRIAIMLRDGTENIWMMSRSTAH